MGVVKATHLFSYLILITYNASNGLIIDFEITITIKTHQFGCKENLKSFCFICVHYIKIPIVPPFLA